LFPLPHPLRNAKSDIVLRSYWVKHRVDVFLVCGRTLEECKKWTTKAAAYFRKKPSGFDIDWARSYYGVKADWLRNVPEKVWL